MGNYHYQLFKLILDLKTDNSAAFFISFGESFHNLGPKLVIVSVPKCAVCMFLFARIEIVYHSQGQSFYFPEKRKPLSLFRGRGHFFTL